MSIQIKLKNSVVQDSTPSASDLPEVGELAVNGNINSIGGFMRASDNTIVKIFGPGSVTTPTATTTVSGISELATNSETTTGTATNRVVTPAGLNAVTVAERTTSNTNYVAKAGSTLTGVLTMPNGSNSAPAINFGDSDSGIFGGTNTVSLAAGGTTGLSVFETNVSVPTKLGINGAVPQTPLDVISNASGYAMAVRGRSADDLSQIRFTSNDYGTIFAELESDATYLATRIGGSEKLRVDSSGRLLVGHSSSLNVGSGTGGLLQLSRTTGDVHQSLNLFKADNAGSILAFGKSRSATIGSYTVVQNNDELGVIRFAGADGTDLQSQAASISAFVDGTPGSNDMPGRLVFSTTADGASSPTTRLTIDSGGTSTFTGNITTTGTISSGNINITSVAPIITLTDTNANDDFEIKVNGGLFEINDITNSANRFIIDSSGQVGIGVTPDTWSTGAGITVGTSQGTLWGTGDQINLSGNAYFNSGWKAAASKAGASQIEQALGNINFKVSGSVTADSAITFTNAMRIDSSGRAGIGTTSPSAKLHIIEGTSTPAVKIKSGTSTNQNTHITMFNDNDGGTLALGVFGSSASTFGSTAAADGFISANNNLSVNAKSGVIKFGVGSTPNEKMRIDTAGRLLIGHSSSQTIGGNSHPLVQLNVNSNQQVLTLARFENSSAGPSMILGKSRASSAGNYTVVQNGDSLGSIQFSGADGTDLISRGAAIEAQVDGTPGSNDMPGRLVFMTSSDGSDSPTERMRISSSGLIGIGAGANTGAQIDIQGNAEYNNHIRLRSYQGGAVVEHWNGRGISNNSDTGRLGVGKNGNALIYTSASGNSINAFAIGNSDAKPLIFSTGNAEKARVTGDSVATFLIGTTTNYGIGWTLRGGIHSSACNFDSTDVRTFMDYTSFHSTGSAQSKISFISDGKIFARTTTIQAFSSERRTKKNIVELDLEKAWNTLRDTPFYTFNFKNEIEGTRLHHGPIVDECPEDLIVPTQKEDEVGIINTVNTEKLQYRAYSALQQALKRIEILESEVAALKAA